MHRRLRPRPRPRSSSRPRRPARPRPRSVPGSLIGSGAAIGIASAIVWFSAKSQLHSLDRRLETRGLDGLISGTTLPDAEDDFATINRNRTVSGVLLGTSLAALIAGGVWLTLDYAL